MSGESVEAGPSDPGATDGQKQRQAVNAAEQAIKALAAGNADRARKASQRAVDLDQIGLYTGFGEAVAAAADDLERGGVVSEESWDAVEAALGPGPLALAVAELRK